MVCRALATSPNRLTVYRPADGFTLKNTHASLPAKEKSTARHRPVPGHRSASARASARKRCQRAKTGSGFSRFSCRDRAGQKALQHPLRHLPLQCEPCEENRAGTRGPHLAKRGTYADGKPVDDASLREWIEKGGKNMPGLKGALNAEQIRELVVYLKTL